MTALVFVVKRARLMRRMPGVTWRNALVTSWAMWASLREQTKMRVREGGPR